MELYLRLFTPVSCPPALPEASMRWVEGQIRPLDALHCLSQRFYPQHGEHPAHVIGQCAELQCALNLASTLQHKGPLGPPKFQRSKGVLYQGLAPGVNLRLSFDSRGCRLHFLLAFLTFDLAVSALSAPRAQRTLGAGGGVVINLVGRPP